MISARHLLLSWRAAAAPITGRRDTTHLLLGQVLEALSCAAAAVMWY